jgi:hypothetical protein
MAALQETAPQRDWEAAAARYGFVLAALGARNLEEGAFAVLAAENAPQGASMLLARKRELEAHTDERPLCSPRVCTDGQRQCGD